MFDLTFDIHPTIDQVKAFVREVEKEALKDLKPFWNDYAQPLVAEEVARCFATQGYGTWEPLSPKYAYWKARHYPGRTILRRSNMLFNAATRKGQAGNIYEANAKQMTWGVDPAYFAQGFGFPYPIMHEMGGAKMPRRPIFDLVAHRKPLQDNLVNAFKMYLSKKIEKEAKKLPQG